jgi:O-antigen/teichoic acid export membrane protein
MRLATITEAQKFGSDIIWVAFSQVATFLVALVTLPAITKSYSPEIYGVWAQATVTIGLLIPIMTLLLGTALVRFLAGEEDKEKRRQLLGAMLWPVLVCTCLVLLLSILFRRDLSLLLFAAPQYVTFISLIFLWAAMEALLSFVLYYLIAVGKIKRQAVIQLILSIAKIALIVALATAGYRLERIIAGLIALEAFFVMAVFWMIIRQTGFPKPNFNGLGRFLAFSVPLILSTLLLWIVTASDRYFIAHLINLSQTAIYSASYALAGIISLFSAPIAFVLFPAVSKLWSQREPVMVKNYLEYSTRLFLALAIPGAIGLYMLSQPLLAIITTSDYLVGGGLVLLLAVGTILFGIYQINFQVILLVQQTKWLLLMVGIAAAVNAGINIALIPRIGTIGAAISAGVSYFVLATIATIWAWRVVGYKIDWKFLLKVIFAAIVMAFCLRFIELGSALSIILAVIGGVVVYALGLFLTRAFSREDLRLAREMLALLNPKMWIE